MLQLIGRTYRITVALTIFVGFYQSLESGAEHWETVTTLVDRGEGLHTRHKWRTRTEAMRHVRLLFSRSAPIVVAPDPTAPEDNHATNYGAY